MAQNTKTNQNIYQLASIINIFVKKDNLYLCLCLPPSSTSISHSISSSFLSHSLSYLSLFALSLPLLSLSLLPLPALSLSPSIPLPSLHFPFHSLFYLTPPPSFPPDPSSLIPPPSPFLSPPTPSSSIFLPHSSLFLLGPYPRLPITPFHPLSFPLAPSQPLPSPTLFFPCRLLNSGVNATIDATGCYQIPDYENLLSWEAPRREECMMRWDVRAV